MRITSICVLLTVFFLTACANQGSSRAREVSIRYASITEIRRVPIPSAAPAGAMVGGFTGLMLARKANPGRQLAAGLGGAALGGLVTHALEGDRRAYEYKLNFKGGESTHYITENGFLHIGDCVAVERGRYANMRRVSDVLCEGTKPAAPEPKNALEASQCNEAKDQLLMATTDPEVSQASRKVKILCQF